MFPSNTYLPPAVTIPGTLGILFISQSYPMEIYYINSEYNTYIVGQQVRLFIPYDYGMPQANGLVGVILEIDDVNNIFYLNIDSTNFDKFAYEPEISYPGLPLIIFFVNGFINLMTTLNLPSDGSIKPGSLLIGYNSNYYSDPDYNGVLVGNPAGTGTVNYLTGDVQFASFVPGSFNGTVFSLTYYPDGIPQISQATLSPAGSKNLQYSNITDFVGFQNLSNEGN